MMEKLIEKNMENGMKTTTLFRVEHFFIFFIFCFFILILLANRE